MAFSRRNSTKQYDKKHREKSKLLQSRKEPIVPDKEKFKSSAATNEMWNPSFYVAVKILVTVRLCSSMWGIINDCDEVFNYWEPTHYLLFGKGLQTWEYSPQYALRSYSYLWLHGIPSYIYGSFLQTNRMLVFFFLRCMLGIVSAVCEIYLYRGVCKILGLNIGRLYLGITVFAAGMFISTTAYLPSSFAMYMVFLSYGGWFHGHNAVAIVFTAVSTLIGWPFASILGAPIAYDIIVSKRKITFFIRWCFISLLTILVPITFIDSYHYGRFVMAPLNLVFYNVFTSHGPDLYGTEPASFYLFNGVLNFNVAFFMALASFPIYLFRKYICRNDLKNISVFPYGLICSGMYAWLIIFTYQSHKEERFLFPVYPLLILAASVFLDCFQTICKKLFYSETTPNCEPQMWKLSLGFLILINGISVSRIISQYKGYSAPFDVMMNLNSVELPQQSKNVTVCYGKEWHRFPSSFFLPDDRWSINFVASEFRGQLPKYFESWPSGTSVIPSNMNDMNKEEVKRYVPVSSCNFLIDLETGNKSPREPIYSELSNWKIIYTTPFLEATRSPLPFRAFYIPYFTELYCSYGNYVLLQNEAVR